MKMKFILLLCSTTLSVQVSASSDKCKIDQQKEMAKEAKAYLESIKYQDSKFISDYIKSKNPDPKDIFEFIKNFERDHKDLPLVYYPDGSSKGRKLIGITPNGNWVMKDASGNIFSSSKGTDYYSLTPPKSQPVVVKDYGERNVAYVKNEDGTFSRADVIRDAQGKMIVKVDGRLKSLPTDTVLTTTEFSALPKANQIIKAPKSNLRIGAVQVLQPLTPKKGKPPVSDLAGSDVNNRTPSQMNDQSVNFKNAVNDISKNPIVAKNPGFRDFLQNLAKDKENPKLKKYRDEMEKRLKGCL